MEKRGLAPEGFLFVFFLYYKSSCEDGGGVTGFLVGVGEREGVSLGFL